MSCKHCHELSIAWRVKFDDGFDYLLALLHGEVNAGTLREAPRRVTSRGKSAPPFATLTADGDFGGERLAYEFSCVFCGGGFELRIDAASRSAEWRARS